MEKIGMVVTEVSSGLIGELNLALTCSKSEKKEWVTIIFENGLATLKIRRGRLKELLDEPLFTIYSSRTLYSVRPRNLIQIFVKGKTEEPVNGNVGLIGEDEDYFVLKLSRGRRKLYEFGLMEQDKKKIMKYVELCFLYLGKDLSELGIVPQIEV